MMIEALLFTCFFCGVSNGNKGLPQLPLPIRKILPRNGYIFCRSLTMERVCADE